MIASVLAEMEIKIIHSRAFICIIISFYVSLHWFEYFMGSHVCVQFPSAAFLFTSILEEDEYFWATVNQIVNLKRFQQEGNWKEKKNQENLGLAIEATDVDVRGHKPCLLLD